MVNITFSPEFERLFSKIKDGSLKEKVVKQIMKLEKTPESGKPMRYSREGTRELYVSPYRLSYIFNKDEDSVRLIDLYHKDEQ